MDELIAIYLLIYLLLIRLLKQKVSLHSGLEQLRNQGRDHLAVMLASVVCFPFKPLYTVRRQPTQQLDQIVLMRAAWQQDRTFMYCCLGSAPVDTVFHVLACRKVDEEFQPPRCLLRWENPARVWALVHFTVQRCEHEKQPL